MILAIKTKSKLSTKKITGPRMNGNLILPIKTGLLQWVKINYSVVIMLEVEVYTSRELSN